MSNDNQLYEMPAKGVPQDKVSQDIDTLFLGMTPEQKGKLASTAFWGFSIPIRSQRKPTESFFLERALLVSRSVCCQA